MSVANKVEEVFGNPTDERQLIGFNEFKILDNNEQTAKKLCILIKQQFVSRGETDYMSSTTLGICMEYLNDEPPDEYFTSYIKNREGIWNIEFSYDEESQERIIKMATFRDVIKYIHEITGITNSNTDREDCNEV